MGYFPKYSNIFWNSIIEMKKAFSVLFPRGDDKPLFAKPVAN